jgi:hypothetical protein
VDGSEWLVGSDSGLIFENNLEIDTKQTPLLNKGFLSKALNNIVPKLFFSEFSRVKILKMNIALFHIYIGQEQVMYFLFKKTLFAERLKAVPLSPVLQSMRKCRSL